MIHPRRGRRVQLPEGFRLVKPQDALHPLRTGVPLMDRYGFSEYCEWGHEPGSMVIVREIEGVPIAVMHLRLQRDHIRIDMLARDVGAPKGSGAALLVLAESVVARQLGVKQLRLEALGAELAVYYRLHGYEACGDPYRDPEWGLLIPMRKVLP